jgi:hypothetical protein
MKVVALKVLGSDREPLILELRPGMTTEDLLAEADLANYCLIHQSDSMTFLPREEVLFDLLTDCEMVYAQNLTGCI